MSGAQAKLILVLGSRTRKIHALGLAVRTMHPQKANNSKAGKQTKVGVQYLQQRDKGGTVAEVE